MDRFITKVAIKDAGCMEWEGWTNGSGYGKFYATQEEPKAYAHRWAWESLVGPIPNGMTIDHLCRNTLCVNPDHLEVVTQAENIARGTALERAVAWQHAKTHCVHGHEFTPENTYRWRGRDGRQRSCKACGRERMRRRRTNAKKEQS